MAIKAGRQSIKLFGLKGGRVSKRIQIRDRLVAVVCAALVSVCTISAQSNENSALGVNFWFFTDYQYIWPFVDFFKCSRPFWPQPANGTYPWSSDGVTLTLDSDGYPTSLPSGVGAATLLFWGGSDVPIPTGDFVCLYDGQGDIGFAYNATVKSRAAGRIVVTVPNRGEGVLLKITQTTPGNHVRNIRFIAPGFEETYAAQPFHPVFLERLAPFRVLRFMDWMATNESANDEWANRPLTTWQTQSQHRGLALEHMIRLCNTLDADPWFCMPHKASDDFMRQFITMVRDSLKPGLKAYYEYSNEVWNGMFQSRGYCEQMGTQLGLGSGWGACVAFWSKRMGDMFDIVDEVYGSERAQRAVRVVATQVGNTGVLSGLLSNATVAAKGDAVAVAPYFGGSGGDVASVVASAASNAANVDNVVAGDKAIADQHGMKLVCYESGLDLWSLDDNLATSVRFDSRMKDVYTTYLNEWRKGGGTLMVQYTFCNPAWGLMKYIDQNPDLAPMYVAAQEWITANPRWWNEERITAVEYMKPVAGRQADDRLFTARDGGTVILRLPHGVPGVVSDLSGRSIGSLDSWGSPGAGIWGVPAPGAYLLRMKSGGAEHSYRIVPLR